MSSKTDWIKKKYKPLLDKTLKNALAHRIGKEFPRIGGMRIRSLCAEMLLEVFNAHVRQVDRMHHGQILWMGISVNDPPRYSKTTAESDLIPVVLDLSCAEDIEDRLNRKSPRERLKRKVVRLCHQAYKQGALLSNCDLSEILNVNDSYIGTLLNEYESDTGRVVPRRATLHDVGSGFTHKRIICLKRYMEGKATQKIAKETYHNVDSVDRYLAQYDRVQFCCREGMSCEQIAYTLNCSSRLVEEYLNINREVTGER